MLALERHPGQALERCPRSRENEERAMPEKANLQTAEGHVLQGEIHVARQKGIVDLKRSRGQPTELSEIVLQTLEASLALHREHLDQLQAAQP